MSDGVHNYLYDAENRIKSIDSGATTYSYDAEDRRVAKTTGGLTTDFIYDREGHIILTNPATPTLMEMYAAGLHLGTYEENTQHTDTIFFYDHGDWLGTERARVDLTGTVCETITSLPFGDNQVMSGSCVDVSPMHFTGKMRDTESNLDILRCAILLLGVGPFHDGGLGRQTDRCAVCHVRRSAVFELVRLCRKQPRCRVLDPTGRECHRFHKLLDGCEQRHYLQREYFGELFDLRAAGQQLKPGPAQPDC